MQHDLISDLMVCLSEQAKKREERTSDDADKLREMITTMDLYRNALQDLYVKPFLSFKRLREMVSWVTKNPKEALAALARGGLGGAGAGVVGYAVVHAAGWHTGVAAAFPALVGALGAPVTAGVVVGGAFFVTGLVIFLLALGVVHFWFKTEEPSDLTIQKDLDAMIEKINKQEILTVNKIVKLREAFESLVKEATVDDVADSSESWPIPPHDSCPICLDNFEPSDFRSSSKKPIAKGWYGCFMIWD